MISAGGDPAWAELKSLIETVEDAAPAAGELLLAKFCRQNPALATRARALVAALDSAPAEFDTPAHLSDSSMLAAVGSLSPELSEEVPDCGREYQVMERIGEGGLGVVYRAQQLEPVKRTVAIKVIKPGMNTREILTRFELEHRALSLMNHPAIARVYTAGETSRGAPYFVLEYVDGVPITDYCDRERLSLNDRLELFIAICDGVQHAHQKALIHRDLKPGNVLVANDEGKPQPKIIDFGIAKATEQRLTEQTLQTQQGQILGTLGYMAPEQADFDADNIDTRADVYSLGVILYELLVGALPFDFESLRGRGFAEMLRVLREDEPPRPSTRLLGLTATGNGSDTGSDRTLVSQLRGDLDWIVMKAIETEPGRRYSSASELAADVRRYLDVEPIVARPPSRVYRLRKLIRRQRQLVFGVTLAALALTIGLVWALVERDRAETENQRFHLVADLQELRNLGHEAEAFPFVRMADVGELQRWLIRADDVLANHEQRRVALELLQARLSESNREPGDRSRELGAMAFLRDTLLRFDLEADPFRRQWLTRMEHRNEVAELSLTNSLWEEILRESPFLSEPDPALVPLGKNRHGQWEFWFPEAGARPQFNTDAESPSEWIITPETGLVMVLVPPGPIVPGAEAEVDAFWMSKYELTESQWARLRSDETVEHPPSAWPVMGVTWLEAVETMKRWGLLVPSDPEWERAARGDTATTWSWGDDPRGAQANARVGLRSGDRTGAVAVFRRENETWELEQELEFPDEASGKSGSMGLAAGGDRIFSGMKGRNRGRGVVYEHRLDREGAWQLMSTLRPAGGSGASHFGHAVAFDSARTLLIGAPHDNESGPLAGAAYLFERHGFGWQVKRRVTGRGVDRLGYSVGIVSPNEWLVTINPSYRQMIEPSVRLYAGGESPGETLPVDLAPGGGAVCATDGQRLVIGSLLEDDGQGRVRVFRRGHEGAWTYEATLTASDGRPRDRFGSELALAGDVIVVTSARGGHTDGVPCGFVYVFRHRDGQWRQEQKLVPESAKKGMLFGSSLAASFQRIVVGAAGAKIGEGPAGGAAFVYARDPEQRWNLEGTLVHPGALANARFGGAVAMDGDRVVVGAPQMPRINRGPRTAAVGSYAANPFGLHDTIGNVAEWTRDPVILERSPNLPLKSIRGGHYAKELAPVGTIATGSEGQRGPVGVRPIRPVAR